MELIDFFKTNCRGTRSVFGDSCTLSFKTLVSSSKSKHSDGTAAVFTFDGYSIYIYFLKSGRASIAENTVFITVTFDCDEDVMFSVYDLLVFLKPGDFNCYTYPYVDTESAMRECFGEINSLLKNFTVLLNSLLSDGILRNKIIAAQKKQMADNLGFDVNDFVGLGAMGDRIAESMKFDFFSDEVDRSVLGAQGLFYEGKAEKALKLLKKAKKRSPYEEALYNYLAAGNGLSESAQNKNDGSYKNARQLLRSTGNLSIKKDLPHIVLCILPVAAVLVILYFAVSFALFAGAEKVLGLNAEHIFLAALFSLPPGVCIHRIYITSSYVKKNGKKKFPPLSELDRRLKPLIILCETVAVVGVLCIANMNVAFYGDHMTYPTKLFPLKQERCDYSYIDSVVKLEGYYVNGKFKSEEHYVLKLKGSGVIDLYDETYRNCKEFEEEILPILSEKGIEVKSAKSDKDIK